MAFTIVKHWDDNERAREGRNGRVYASTAGRWVWSVIEDDVVVEAFDLKREATAYIARQAEAQVVVDVPDPARLGLLLDETRAVREGLAALFGEEWRALSTDDQALLVRDCTEDGGVDDLNRYRISIGNGHLLAYVKTQRVRFAKKGGAR